jgi:TPR repeat protein
VAKDEAKAVELYARAVDAGSFDAMANLWACYENGVGVDKDVVAAVDPYSRAAAADVVWRFCVLHTSCRMGLALSRMKSEL